MRYAATILAVLLGTCLLAQNYTADRVTIKTGGTLKMRPGSVLELAGYGVTAISNDPTAGSSSTTSLITEAGAKGYANTRGRVDSAALVQSGKAVYLVCYSSGGDTLAVDTVSIGGVGGAFVSGDSVFLVINGDTIYAGLDVAGLPVAVNGLARYADSIGLGGTLDRIAYIRAETDAGLYLVNADTTKGLTLGQVVSFFSDAGSSHFVALPDSSISLGLEDGGKLQVQGEIGGSAQWRARMSGGRETFDDFRADKRGREYSGHYPGIKGHPRSIPDVGLVNEMLSDSIGVLRDSLGVLKDSLSSMYSRLQTVEDSLGAIILPGDDIANLRTSRYIYFDEFANEPYSGGANSAIGDYRNGYYTVSGSAFIVEDTAKSYNNARLFLSSTSGNYRGVLRMPGTMTKQDGDFALETRLELGNISGGYVINVGLTESLAGNTTGSTNQILMNMSSPPSSFNWRSISYDNAGATSTIDTGVPFSGGTPITMRFEYDHAPTPTYRIYMDGALVATETSNLPHPSKTLVFFAYVSKTTGTVNPSLWLDWLYFVKDK